MRFAPVLLDHHLDYKSSRLGGRQFATRYRDVAAPPAPLVLMTVAQRTHERCAEARADGCRGKRFTLSTLMQTVERLARPA